MSGEAVHTHHAIKPQADGSLLSNAEQRSAARQLTLAMLALGLLALGLVWRFSLRNRQVSANCCWALPRCWWRYL